MCQVPKDLLSEHVLFKNIYFWAVYCMHIVRSKPYWLVVITSFYSWRTKSNSLTQVVGVEEKRTNSFMKNSWVHLLSNQNFQFEKFVRSFINAYVTENDQLHSLTEIYNLTNKIKLSN